MYTLRLDSCTVIIAAAIYFLKQGKARHIFIVQFGGKPIFLESIWPILMLAKMLTACMIIYTGRIKPGALGDNVLSFSFQ